MEFTSWKSTPETAVPDCVVTRKATGRSDTADSVTWNATFVWPLLPSAVCKAVLLKVSVGAASLSSIVPFASERETTAPDAPLKSTLKNS